MEYKPTPLRRRSQRKAFPCCSRRVTERRASRTSFVTFPFLPNRSSSAIWKAPWQMLWYVKLLADVHQENWRRELLRVFAVVGKSPLSPVCGWRGGIGQGAVALPDPPRIEP